MHSYDLKENLICYWQDGGWHGCHKIIRFNKRYVYYVEYSDYKINNKQQDEVPQLYHQALNKFLKDHEINSNLCEYSGYHRNKFGKCSIGQIIP
jgi:hypothetical protein